MRARLDVSPERGEMAWRVPPHNHQRLRGLNAGSLHPSQCRTKNYWHVKKDRHAFKRSWLIFLWVNGRWPADCIDHIDGNSENDAIGNLREANITQNAWNHKGRAKRTPLPMGVREMPSGRFQARIAQYKRKITIGVFDDADSAAAAYQAKRRELFREFA